MVPEVAIANLVLEVIVPSFVNVPTVPLPLLIASASALVIVPSLSIAVTLEESGTVNPIVVPVTVMLPELVIESEPELKEHAVSAVVIDPVAQLAIEGL